MTAGGQGHYLWRVVLLAVWAAACSSKNSVPPAAPAAPTSPVALTVASAEPDWFAESEPPLVPPQSLAAVHDPVALELPIRRYYRGRGLEIAGLELPLPVSRVRRIEQVRLNGGGWAVATTGVELMQEQEARQGQVDSPTLWVLAPAGQIQKLDGTLLQAAADGKPGMLIDFRVTGRPPPSQKSIRRWWLEAFDNRYAPVQTPFHQFALRATAAMLGSAPAPPSRFPTELDLLDALQRKSYSAITRRALLQAHRALWTKRSGAAVPLTRLQRPSAMSLPYAHWRGSAAGGWGTLSQWVPADFAFARSPSVVLLNAALRDLAELAVLRDGLGGMTADRGLERRLRRQLGWSKEFEHGLTPAVVEEVGLASSDWEVDLGGDLSVLLRLKDVGRFDELLGESLSTHVGVKHEATDYAGVRIHHYWADDGLELYLMETGEVAVLSNSPGALRVIAGAKTGDNLYQQEDYRYLLSSRNVDPEQVLLFVGERYIAARAAPARHILRLRRWLAEAELEVPRAATLLYRHLFGRAPRGRAALAGTQLLSPGSLRHRTGERIHFEPGRRLESSWGRPEHLKALIDLPVPATVSKTELRAYELFAERWKLGGGGLRSPTLLTLSADGSAMVPSAWHFELSSVPLHPAYMPYLQWLGGAEFAPEAPSAALALSVAVGAETPWLASLRAALSELAALHLPAEMGPSLDLLAEDRAELAKLAELAMRWSDPTRQLSISSILAELKTLPLALRLRGEWGDEDPLSRAALELHEPTGALRWLRGRSARGVQAWQLQFLKGACAGKECPQVLHWAKVGGSLIVSPREGTLWRTISRLTSKKEIPKPLPQSHLAVQLGMRPGGGGELLLERLAEAPLGGEDAGRSLMEVLYASLPRSRRRQVPALARHWFGFLPLTPAGELYQYRSDGMLDPSRGTAASPVLRPRASVDSMMARWIRALGRSNWTLRLAKEGQWEGDTVHSLVIGGTLARILAPPGESTRRSCSPGSVACEDDVQR